MSKRRDLDVVVYGATGFTGQLVAEYLASRYGTDSTIRWALAGRNCSKLEQVRETCGAPPETELLVADADEPATLRAMAQRAKVVLTTVGPYQLYGEPLIAACASEGTDYVDLCGEPLFMAKVIETYSDTARASGARIVFSCGFDSIPFDLGVLFLQNAARARFGAPMPRVKGRVRKMVGTFSGGTAASLKATMAALGRDPSLLQRMIDPFALTPGFSGPPQPPGNKPLQDPSVDAWVAPFIMAAINTKNVHRSNFLLDHAYGKDFVYDEMLVVGSGDEGAAAAQAISKHNPLAGDKAPKPGEGPSRAEREAGSYDVLFIGEHPNGHTLRAVVTGDMDPGYGSTSKMIAESALCLVQDHPAGATGKGGIYTPAPLFGETLVERLVERAGLTFDIVER